MPIEILEILPGRDWDTWRGYSQWLFIRFPPCKNKPKGDELRQMTRVARTTFIRRYGYEPLLIQNIEWSAWWRAGPMTEEAME